MSLSNQQLSQYRQSFNELVSKIESLCFKLASSEALIKGSPGEVYRTCGRSYCPCSQDKAKRHGPYRVIQVRRSGKSRQVSLKKTQEAEWQKAQRYQQTMQLYVDLKSSMQALEQLVKELLKKRIEEFP